MKDYYKILNIGKNASKDDIKKSYRKLSKKYHPDVNPNGEKMFKDVTEAYEVLSNDNKRREYDNPKDTFSDFFQHFNSGRKRRTVPSKKIILKVSVEDIYLSKNKDLTYQVTNSCSTCGGDGGDVTRCGNCGGSGHIQTTFGSGFFRQTTTQTCGHCNGTGNKVINPCYNCGGKGTKFKFENINVKIPKDIDDGSRMKIREKGDFHSNVGRGDLEVIFKIVNENGFRKNNNDIVYDKVLNITDIIINNDIIIPHPDGDIKVKIPLNYKSNKPLRIKGKGFKNRNIGDLYINIFFEHKEMSKKDKELILEHINEPINQDI